MNVGVHVSPEVTAAWRRVFSEFGSKPSRYPSSAEALLARVLKGGELPRINALVNTYNAVSLRHVIPVGGEDLDRLRGDLRLVRAADGEVLDVAIGELIDQLEARGARTRVISAPS
jgi:DNA/RNA-binding domain of Phe-tRNA-synthetase-like protein